MGSKYAKSNNEEINNTNTSEFSKTFKITKDYKCEEDFSLNLQTKENTDNSSINTTDILENLKTKNDFVPFLFEWKGDGAKVVLTGSFLNNWTTFVNMEKNEKTGNFEKLLYLPRTKHEFKFIVDNNWVCNTQYQTIPNQYNGMNNFIDLTNVIIPEIANKKEENNIKENKNEDNNSKMNLEEKITKKAKRTYNCQYPLINELNTTAPCIIHHYRPRFNIDRISEQIKIVSGFKRRDWFIIRDKNIYTENNASKKIMAWPHEKLMHLCPNLEDLNEQSINNYFRICTTFRSKHKYLTIVYYKPKQK